VVDHITN